MRVALVMAAVLLAPVAAAEGVGVREDVYEGRPHLVIETPQATTWLDMRSGGLSRLIDSDGHDWIAFRMKPWDKYPAAAAGAFRGFPNMVFGEDPDAGFGHPGHDAGRTQIVSTDGQTAVIDCTSNSGRWAIRWTFTADGIQMDVSKAPAEARYWVLYEGPIGGRFAPTEQTVVRPQSVVPTAGVDFFAGDRVLGRHSTVAFVDDACDSVLAMFQVSPRGESQQDTWAQLASRPRGSDWPEDGMMVFGIGRGPSGIDPQLTGRHSFLLSFLSVPADDPQRARRVQKQLRSLAGPPNKSPESSPRSDGPNVD